MDTIHPIWLAPNSVRKTHCQLAPYSWVKTHSKLQSAWARGLAIVLSLLDLVWYDASVFASTLVNLCFVPRPLTFALELVAAGAQLSNGLLGQ